MHIGVGTLLGDLGFDALVFAVPALCGLLLALSLQVRSRPLQAIFVLGTPCILAYAAGCVYLWSLPAGRIVTYLLYGLCIVASLVLWRGVARDDLRGGLSFFYVAGMTLGAAAFSLALGFLHGGVAHGRLPYGIATASIRYMKHLPIDNDLPYYFAAALLKAHRPIALATHAKWSYSDRPPLETAMYLVLRAFLPGGDPHEVQYQVLGTLLQSLWVPALWCLLVAARLAKRCLTVTILAVMFSGFVIVNSFFIWPKLFSAAFLVLIGAVVLTEDWHNARRSALAGCSCGIAAALAMLGHEGALFAIIPLLMIAVARRARMALRFFLPAAVIFVILLLPWTLFQTKYDPPGTKLAKQQLTNRSPKASQSLLVAVERAYDTTPLTKVMANKWSNLQTPFLNENTEARALYELTGSLFSSSEAAITTRAHATQVLRTDSFYFLAPSAGFLALGLPALVWLLARRRRRENEPVLLSGRILCYLVLNIVIWALVLFGPAQTVIHQGTYATELLAYSALVIGLWELSRILAIVVVALQVAIGVVVYGVVQTNWEIAKRVIQPVEVSQALLAAGAALFVVVVSLAMPKERPVASVGAETTDGALLGQDELPVGSAT